MKRSVVVTVLGLLVGFLTIISPAGNSGAATTGSSAWAWGDNGSGQLGDGTTTNRTSPLQVGTSGNWTDIDGGFRHSLGTKADGTLWGWGDNYSGQIGDGTTTNRTLPVQIGTATNWASITASHASSFGIRNDGTLWAWGLNSNSQLGDGTTIDRTSPVQIGTATNWKSIKLGSRRTLGLKTDGTLWSWGDNVLGDSSSIPAQIGTQNDWASIAAGAYHYLAIKTDGTLWGWGQNGAGQLGSGNTSSQTNPVKIGSSDDWSSISAGAFHSLGIKTDETLWAWGQNDVGQLGDGTTTNRTSPVQIGTATNWKLISAGGYRSHALRTNGTLWSWGANEVGQLGDGTTTNRTSPVQIGTATNWKLISAGGYHSLGLRESTVPPTTTTTTVAPTTTTVAPTNTGTPPAPPFTPFAAFTSPNPTGSFDLATPAPGGARIAGWALDPESPESVSLHIYVGGAFATALTANTNRPDIGQAFPTYGNAHGFDTTIAMGPGLHSVCAYGINIGPSGTNSLIGCRQVTIGANPFGSFDLGTAIPGGARIAGWALDPQSASPVELHVYVDGSPAGSITANGNRPDIAQASPGYGNAHGFDAIVGIQPGFHTVCVYGINIGAGANSLVGCRWVMIESNPFGSLDVVQSVNGGIQVGGWALDPQTADSIEIHVYVDGAIAGSFVANKDRPDIAQAFYGYGESHGFDNVIGATPGTHQVCVFGINKLAGQNALIGCRNT